MLVAVAVAGNANPPESTFPAGGPEQLVGHRGPRPVQAKGEPAPCPLTVALSAEPLRLEECILLYVQEETDGPVEVEFSTSLAGYPCSRGPSASRRVVDWQSP